MTEHEPAPAWLPTLARLWVLRRVRAAPAARPVGAVAVLSLASLALWTAIDRWQSQPDPQFVLDGIPLLAWYALALIALAAILRFRSGVRPPFATMLALVLGIVPVFLLFFGVAEEFLSPTAFLLVCIPLGVYTFLYLDRVLRAVTGAPRRAAAFIGLMFVTGVIGLSDELNVIPDVWTPATAQEPARTGATVDGEAILFAQAARIDEALDAFGDDAATAQSRPRPQPPQTPQPKAYFLGFAGVGDQKVFAQEIGLASRVLGERYGIESRSLLLINDERDLQSAPLATVSGLRYALNRIGERMNRDRDILFLSISSHGSEDPAIAVSNSELPLDDLTDEDLADALRESGIRWRVIVISACYAGAFIEALKDPQTIVIAAAAPHRTSFGCSTDSDLTYFGEAFYRDALPDARGLREAFDAAKVAIGRRERDEQVTPSEPQAYFGKSMQEKLAAFESQRAAGPPHP